MIKKLTAKTQELNPKLPQYSNSFAKCLTIKPESQDLLLKKGTIYVLYDVPGDSNFDTELVDKVITDVLHDFYYQSESISPIQSMEKAILETKDKVFQLSSDTLTFGPKSVALNILSVVLWGNVLYVVQFGSAKSYFMKEGSIYQLEMISEGNFSTSSKVVDEDEVLILCTEQFEKILPPEKLLTSSLSDSDLDPNQACLLMRLLIDASFSEDEVIDFGLGNASSKTIARERFENITNTLKQAGRGVVTGIKIFLSILSNAIRPLVNIFNKIIPKRKAILFTRNITRLSGPKGNKTLGWLFLSIIAVLLATSVFFTLKPVIFKPSDKKEEPLVTKPEEEEKPEETIEDTTEDKSKDEQYKIKRSSPEVFYDLKIVDTQVEPSDIEMVGDKLVVVDKSSGKLYTSDIKSPSFNAIPQTFPGIKSLETLDNLLTFNDNEGYKTYDITTSQVKSSYKLDGLSLTFPYAGFIYSISGDVLSKNTEKDSKLEGTVWAQNPDFVNAKSMAISYNIYILKSNGDLVSYSGGSKTIFKVSGLENPFSDTTKVVTNTNLDNIYVSDRGNKSIAVIDNEGKLVKQYKNDNSSVWNDIRSIAVSNDEKTLLVLNSSKIYKISLED